MVRDMVYIEQIIRDKETYLRVKDYIQYSELCSTFSLIWADFVWRVLADASTSACVFVGKAKKYIMLKL